ncbi:hypothetical protein SAMN05444372_10580 [Flavobacterium micromati]|uniref:Uncharacterized protein n=1 Tax=Flavobacterium micromati TaxID=229205 RepID=A0A1M5J856_9FLAO|nr:hypothetical protein SAMN05444372_10580 [Flavobacterium micromati]
MILFRPCEEVTTDSAPEKMQRMVEDDKRL